MADKNPNKIINSLAKDEFHNLVDMKDDEYEETLTNKKGWKKEDAKKFTKVTSKE